MGYTHYWYAMRRELPADRFAEIAEDFKRLVPVLRKHGVPLADGSGAGRPVIEPDAVIFNGPRKCGHEENAAVVIPWPTAQGAGVAGPGEDARGGTWYAGALVEKRTCNGDCSYEGFALTRVAAEHTRSREPGDGYFNFCKTAFRPYDVAVTACLLVAKHRLGELIRVRTDGEDPQWFDAKMLCQTVLGYGLEYEIGDDGLRRKR